MDNADIANMDTMLTIKEHVQKPTWNIVPKLMPPTLNCVPSVRKEFCWWMEFVSQKMSAIFKIAISAWWVKTIYQDVPDAVKILLYKLLELISQVVLKKMTIKRTVFSLIKMAIAHFVTSIIIMKMECAERVQFMI